MKITEELFNKLSKKEQEEFKLDIKKVKDSYFGSFTLIYLKWFVYYLGFFMIVFPLWFIAFREYNPELLISVIVVLIGLIKFLFSLIFVGFFVDYVLFVVRIFRRNKIKRKYFVVEVKKKR